MSLSFVSSAVLSSSDGVSHNEEKAIESKEVEQLRLKNSGARPLFEQLRANQEAEQERYNEMTKEMHMGMRPLDEEDCAHLDAMESMRVERERMVQQAVEEEVAFFRAAKAEKALEMEQHANLTEKTQEEKRIDVKGSEESSERKVPAIAPVVPKIIGKRKRRKQSPSNKLNNDTKSTKQPRTSIGEEVEAKTESNPKDRIDNKEESTIQNGKQANDSEENNNANEGSLGGLLLDYGSDSD